MERKCDAVGEGARLTAELGRKWTFGAATRMVATDLG
ncbi:hypothetical protein SAMN05444161_3382 [Rhizobiales bacterium GAS191]|nr:hypothetical protein SAMN05519103_02502 [Rhizobiales bacterium GAS113]SED51965.1 hypothetical protein SAMN05444161_3382 [Rhizobiales bacterium GAS191]